MQLSREETLLLTDALEVYQNVYQARFDEGYVTIMAYEFEKNRAAALQQRLEEFLRDSEAWLRPKGGL